MDTGRVEDGEIEKNVRTAEKQRNGIVRTVCSAAKYEHPVHLACSGQVGLHEARHPLYRWSAKRPDENFGKPRSLV